MPAPTYPDLMPLPFASSGAKNTIPEASASPLASLTDGFPPVTMQPISSGGVPPAGQDFNGILFWITQFQTWVNSGGRFKFDATLAAAIGGYPIGAILLLNDDISEVICTAAGNSVDPNSTMTGWAPFAGAWGGGTYVLDTGAVNAYVATQAPPVTSYRNGYRVTFKSIHTNTGASTINTGGGVVALKRSDGAAVLAGDIQSGSIYSAVYDQATNAFWLIDPVASQIATANAYSISASNSSGTPTVTGSSGVLTLNPGATNVDIAFTAKQACSVLVSGAIAASGHDDGAPGGGRGGFKLSFLNGASEKASGLVWVANDGVPAANDYNVRQTVINTSGGSVADNSNVPGVVIQLAANDVLHVSFNPTYLWSAWVLDYWKFIASVAVL